MVFHNFTTRIRNNKAIRTEKKRNAERAHIAEIADVARNHISGNRY